MLSARRPIDFRSFFEEHFDFVWNALRRLGVRAEDLEDVSHELFLRVHGSLHEYDTGKPARPWLFGFAFRVAADHRRLARNRRELVGESAESADPAVPADEQLVAHERRALVREALESIPIDRRAVLVMHEIEGMAAPVIAEALGIPVNTVYSRVRVAREELAAAVKRIRASRGER